MPAWALRAAIFPKGRGRTRWSLFPHMPLDDSEYHVSSSRDFTPSSSRTTFTGLRLITVLPHRPQDRPSFLPVILLVDVEPMILEKMIFALVIVLHILLLAVGVIWPAKVWLLVGR